MAFSAITAPATTHQSKDPLVVILLGEQIRYSHIFYDPKDEYKKDFFNALMELILLVRNRAIDHFKKKHLPQASQEDINRALYKKYGGIVKITKVGHDPVGAHLALIKRYRKKDCSSFIIKSLPVISGKNLHANLKILCCLMRWIFLDIIDGLQFFSLISFALPTEGHDFGYQM